MQSRSEGIGMNIADLASRLRKEKIFINSERQLLQNLNEEVEKNSLELLQVAWICSQQRQNLTNLFTIRTESESVLACQRASLLDLTTFIDAHKVLRYKEANALGELLGWLRDSPHLMALCLLLGEDHMPPEIPMSFVAGLYGSCRSPNDRTRFLSVLRSLIKHQLAPSSDPRKLLQSSKCAFTQLYSVYREGHSPARQFLTTTLLGPVMCVMQEDEFYLDIDPDKALKRFTPEERAKKFGQPNSPEYAAKVARHRKRTVQCLYNFTNKFLQSFRDNWNYFPTTFAWIIHQIVHLLRQHSKVSEREIHTICTDLVLNQFLCPAIDNPEAYGVLELPISPVARHNLMQVAQIIQMLSLARYQEVEPKFRDINTMFERSCVWSLLDALSSGVCQALDTRIPTPEHSALQTEPHSRTTVSLFTREHLHSVITFLKRISSKLNNNTPSITSEEFSSGSGPSGEPYLEDQSRPEPYSCSTSDSSSTDDGCTANLAALLQNIEPNYKSRLHDLLRKLPDFSKLKRTPSTETKEESSPSKRSILMKVAKSRLPRSASSNAALPSSVGNVIEDKTSNGEVREDALDHPEVLVIKLANVEENDYVGLIPESKVLECYDNESEAGDADDAVSTLAVTGPAVQKRTRFSVSHDEVSLGNTSDNLEAVSEVASNHSVTSSFEMETEDQNDNLSDMVSANVSGRGSPNISGRETPSSQMTDGDGAPGDPLPPRRLPQNAPSNPTSNDQKAKLLKQTRNDIDAKFCKFEIKKMLEGDENVSVMSDTWSTDVLASDSETIGDSCEPTQIRTVQATNLITAPDASETASESAWSIDVLASDSDRNTEVDTDDCVSVAARSDSSWPRRPSHHEDIQPRRSNQSGNNRRQELNSPKHTPRVGSKHSALAASYLSATAQLSRGAELDLHSSAIQNRKSILVNGYPVMTCFANSAPESPGASVAGVIPNDVFDYAPPEPVNEAATESTLEEADPTNSDATSQWVDDSFQQPQHSPTIDYALAPTPSTYHLPTNPNSYDLPSTSSNYHSPPANYELPSTSTNYHETPENDLMDQSLNSSESSFNALSVSQYDRNRFETESQTERSTINDLMSRMSSATISTSNLVNNLTSRIVKSEIRTSVVNISSTRIERSKPGASNMSLSTLSVNSAETSISDRSSSQDVNSEIVTERRVSPPPQKVSTGAIPKSISFDSTAEKTQKGRVSGEEVSLVGNLDELKNNVKRSGGNFFNKLKMFRQKGRGHPHPHVPEEEQPNDEGGQKSEPAESSDDILAKYRRKSSSDSSRARRGSSRRTSETPPVEMDLERSEGIVDLDDPEVFNSMKHKLRLVLSNPDLHCIEYMPSRKCSRSLVEWVSAAAGAGGEERGAPAAEVARALAASGAAAARLAAALRRDLAARRPYASYLATCRAGLATCLRALTGQINAIRSESNACARTAAATRVLQQLDKSNALRRLARNHTNNSYAAMHNGNNELLDEMASRLTASIKAITAEVRNDASWEGVSQELFETAEITVERAAFARLYLHVLFPNGDGDIERDQLFREHIRRLRGVTTAARAGIAPRHQWAAPYVRAQRPLAALAVCRAPRDKVSCVSRCVRCMLSVLGLADAAPSADDLTPVLVYLIIRVNPPFLLSTIELVQALGGPALSGEALYCWTMFCAAITHVRSMDYT